MVQSTYCSIRRRIPERDCQVNPSQANIQRLSSNRSDAGTTRRPTRNVRVINCSVNSPWDDGICLKSSFGLGHARVCEMVTISDCLLTGSLEEGTLLDGSWKPFPADSKIPRNGRIKFGTESNGGFKRITISNCVFDGCRGLALETVDGAILEDVTVTNISMRDIVDGPIFIRLGDRMRGPEGVPVGVLRRVIISNIVCSNAASNISSLFTGVAGHPVEDVKLSNILIEHRGGGIHDGRYLPDDAAADRNRSGHYRGRV